MSKIPLSKAVGQIQDTFNKVGVTTYSRYIKGEHLTFFTEGLKTRGWPELMIDHSSQLLADLTIATVLEEWERRGGPFTGDAEYTVSKNILNLKSEYSTHLGIKYIKVSLIPKAQLMKKTG